MKTTVFGRVTVLLFVLLTLAPAPSLFADLGDFAESVEEEKNESDTDKSESYDDDDDEEEEGGFIDFLFSITALVWLYHNSSVWYTEYPYEYGSERPALIGYDWENPGKQSRLVVSSAGGAFWEGTDMGWTGSARINGKFGALIGPDLEYRIWSDNSGQLQYLRAGLAVPIVQNDWFSWDLNIGGGFFFDLLRLNAAALGSRVTVYPFRPISLEIRGGAILAENVEIGELGAKIGVHLDRFEVLTGYYGLYQGESIIHTLEIGGAVHF